jgi:TonB family protein
VIAAAMLASVAFHLLLFLVWQTVPVLPEPGSQGAAASKSPWKPGGGALWATNVALPRQVEIPPPPRPRLDPDAPIIERVEMESASPTLALTPAAAGLAGRGTGVSGGGTGDGEGAGGGGRLVAPVPRSLVPQWDPPDDVRGLRVTIRVEVDKRGRATGQVELVPPTPNKKFNRQLMDKARRMQYYPARRDGRPVTGWAEITFVF